MRKTLAEIAKIIEGEVVGDKNIVITGLSGLSEAKMGDLTFLASPPYLSLAKTTQASAIVTSPDFKFSGKPTILIKNPSLAFANLVAHLVEEDPLPKKGIHPAAIVAKDAILGKNVSIGPYVVVESKSQIGDETIIYPGSYIGYKTIIGQNCLIYPNVTIRERNTIGNRVIIHSGCVVGSDGFGYEQDKGVHKKIRHVGNVVIEDDVELGANVTIDRARINRTFIGRGTKIDNLVHIAHNVLIGENCLIVAQVGISGSTVVEKNCILAGQVGLVGHITIGENSIIAAQSGVPNSLPANSRVWGYPAKPMMEAKRLNASLQRLPLYVKEIHELKKKIELLEKQINKS